MTVPERDQFIDAITNGIIEEVDGNDGSWFYGCAGCAKLGPVVQYQWAIAVVDRPWGIYEARAHVETMHYQLVEMSLRAVDKVWPIGPKLPEPDRPAAGTVTSVIGKVRVAKVRDAA